MKNVLFIFFLSLFSLCFFVSCDPEEGAILPDVDFTISPNFEFSWEFTKKA